MGIQADKTRNRLVALDVAVLLPEAAHARALELSDALWRRGSRGVHLDAGHLPHITLTQQFVFASQLRHVLRSINRVLRHVNAMRLRVSGGAKGGSSVWMTIQRTPALVALHQQLMDALYPFEQRVGTPAAFFDADARLKDIAWVTGYRATASFESFRPHVTLGHADRAPKIAPFSFEASTVAACHLGHFCSCRRVFRSWPLARD